MTSSTVNQATCDALTIVPSEPFTLEIFTLSDSSVPFSSQIADVQSQLPYAVPTLVLSAAVILWLVWRYVPKPDRPTQRALTGTVLFVGVVGLTGMVGSYWLVPGIAAGLWQHEKLSWIEPGLSGANKVASTLSNKVENHYVRGWARFISQVYDHHTARLLLEYPERLNEGTTQQLLDTVLNTEHVRFRLRFGRYDLNGDETAQLFILTKTARDLASHAFDAGNLQAALKHAMQGYDIDQSNAFFEGVVLPIRGQMVHQHLQAQEAQAAFNQVLALPHTWRHPQFLKLIEATQYAVIKANLSRKDNDRWGDAITQSESLQRHYLLAAPDGQPSIHSTCNIAFLHSMHALFSLQANSPQDALNSLVLAQETVTDSPFVKEMMPTAHYAIGANHANNQHYALAAQSFERAYALNPTRQLACDTANALRMAGFDDARTGRLDAAETRASKAKALCTNDVVDYDLSIEVGLKVALRHLQYGRWELANQAFSQLPHDPRVHLLARYHLADIGQARARHAKLVGSPHMLSIPTVTGQYCAEFVETDGHVQCTAVSLFNGTTEVGRSVSETLTDVIFVQSSGYLAVYDKYGNDAYDTWEQQQGGLASEWVDMDGDYRPDYHRSFAEGRQTSFRQLSGRISMRFLGGLVNKRNVDWLSRPDIFLVASKNGSYFGRTETVNNNTRPVWSDYFVFDYKYGDRIQLWAVDEDLFNNEDVDQMQFDGLPDSGYIEMDGRNITLFIQVAPSTRPEGHYRGEKGESVFTDEAFFSDDTPIAEQVRKTYEEDARAQIMTTVAAIIIPEAGIFALIRNARFAEHLIAGWLGFEATDAVLNHTE